MRSWRVSDEAGAREEKVLLSVLLSITAVVCCEAKEEVLAVVVEEEELCDDIVVAVDEEALLQLLLSIVLTAFGVVALPFSFLLCSFDHFCHSFSPRTSLSLSLLVCLDCFHSFCSSFANNKKQSSHSLCFVSFRFVFVFVVSSVSTVHAHSTSKAKRS